MARKSCQWDKYLRDQNAPLNVVILLDCCGQKILISCLHKLNFNNNSLIIARADVVERSRRSQKFSIETNLLRKMMSAYHSTKKRSTEHLWILKKNHYPFTVKRNRDSPLISYMESFQVIQTAAAWRYNSLLLKCRLTISTCDLEIHKNRDEGKL